MFDYLKLKERFWGTEDCYDLFSRWGDIMKDISMRDITNDILFDEKLFVSYFKKYGNASDDVIETFLREKNEFIKDAEQTGDITTEPAKNSMQKAFIEFTKNGGVLHNGGIIIL